MRKRNGVTLAFCFLFSVAPHGLAICAKEPRTSCLAWNNRFKGKSDRRELATARNHLKELRLYSSASRGGQGEFLPGINRVTMDGRGPTRDQAEKKTCLRHSNRPPEGCANRTKPQRAQRGPETNRRAPPPL
jgi:hypothetical protein